MIATWKLVNCEAPTGLALDVQNRRLFAVCDNNKMDVVDADTGKELAAPAIGDSPDAARFSATHQLAFSSNGGGTLTVVDAANGYKVIENLPTPKGAQPWHTMRGQTACSCPWLSMGQLRRRQL